MSYYWEEITYFSMLGMYILGIISGLTANWLFDKYKVKRAGNKEYFTMTIQDNSMRFEGRNKIDLYPEELNKIIYQFVKDSRKHL